ncbi:hypothetical protein A4D02_30830 [Niastella koreensis]|uniref:Uncharacterized protein n=2 Tax=Niastella koreensis TaxID=354356 RepID=G8T8Y4_NIAKG|nr:hypothetical protein [Niastella koreensis]AEW02341.1 hypothetical protein Niako_6116 [Niastella koreensis GR20-10]OQP46438.1 hypothetical protein A4D02_30830 [Niastella koreensis]
MSLRTILLQHNKETNELKSAEKGQWNQLLERQENALLDSDGNTNLAGRFAKERDEHNDRFRKEKAELMSKHQQELEEYKRSRQQSRSDRDRER